MRYRESIVGTLNEKGLYLVGYRAPVIYYYDRDAAAFQSVLGSFSIATPAAGR